ncbi:hypothetical protein DNU06_07280 [Putridiphycobacter roseus]|uniref:Uncharacterized protein n=1 Tax=Putridiphycobacter roseus TaxID=2219161 RepID=A0A2W1N1F7_9FLAO|nr:hypothetical protein [Putridiphycobacter roseus]PZE17624.1 hypothetical protein DNU06_07280 [Putridiphycobacter roseus]
MIGADFEKIEFVVYGLNLLEPMALITDAIMGGLSVYYGIKTLKMKKGNSFYKLWAMFFLFFGIGSIIGGIGHTFYNYFGLLGKFPSWVSGPIAVYFIEKAMISLHWNETLKKRLMFWFNVKLVLIYAAFLFILFFVDNPAKPNLPFLPIAFNTIFGLILTAGILGFKYTQKISVKFKYFWLGILIMSPSALIFLFKINLYQWFDKNDFSHVLITIGITYFYLGLKKLSTGLK